MSIKEIKKIDVFSVAKIVTVVYFLVMLIIFVPLGLVSTLFNTGDIFPFAGAFAMFLMPFIYGIIVFITVSIFCYLYNFFAERIGGIKIHLEEEETGAPE